MTNPNHPCPCGSGRKFKRCCEVVRDGTWAAQDRAERAALAAKREAEAAAWRAAHPDAPAQLTPNQRLRMAAALAGWAAGGLR